MIKKKKGENMKMKNWIKKILFVLVVYLFCCSYVLAKGGRVYVRGYYRKDGTYVKPHYRTAPDGNPYNNYSFPGNYNPNTGKFSSGNPDTYLRNYYNKGSSSSYGSEYYYFKTLPSYSTPTTTNDTKDKPQENQSEINQENQINQTLQLPTIKRKDIKTIEDMFK